MVTLASIFLSFLIIMIILILVRRFNKDASIFINRFERQNKKILKVINKIDNQEYLPCVLRHNLNCLYKIYRCRLRRINIYDRQVRIIDVVFNMMFDGQIKARGIIIINTLYIVIYSIFLFLLTISYYIVANDLLKQSNSEESILMLFLLINITVIISSAIYFIINSQRYFTNKPLFSFLAQLSASNMATITQCYQIQTRLSDLFTTDLV
jgi:hypothetical protein